MEPKNSADNSAPSMPKQDDQGDPAVQSSQEVTVDIAEGQDAAKTEVPKNPDQIGTPAIDDTSAGLGSAAAQGTVDDMPSLTSEAPTDQVAAAPTEPAEGAPTPGEPGQPGSTDRLGALGDSTPAATPGESNVVATPPAASQEPVLTPNAASQPAPGQADQNAVPPTTPAAPAHDSKMMLILVGAGALVIVVIALVFLI